MRDNSFQAYFHYKMMRDRFSEKYLSFDKNLII
jgi:hypothetical protein